MRKHGPTPRGPLEREASRLLTQMRGKWSVWRAEWNNTVTAWLSSCVVGCWSLRWCMLSLDEGRAAGATGQIQGQSSGTKPGDEAEETSGVSPPSSTSWEAAHSVCEGRNAGTLDCSPKGANLTKKPTAKRRGDYWGSCARMTMFSSTCNQLHVFFESRREILHGPLCKDDTYILIFLKQSSMAPARLARALVGDRGVRKECAQ